MALISLSTNVPRSYRQSTSPEQLNTLYPEIDEEYDSLLRCKTWKLVKREPYMRLLSSKYVFRMNSSRSEARLVVLGFLQVHGVDFMESNSPAVNIITV